MHRYDKIVVLGSGALKIGEAGEFDYSGSQCLKALEEEGIYAIVVNPNIATLQTDPPKHGRVYFQPLQPEFVEPILEAEAPDGILLSFGGQSALNCGIELADRGALRRHKTEVLGTPLAGIRATEDRAKFVRAMERAKVPTLPSKAVYSVDEAVAAAGEFGYPVMVRVAFTLGGKGGGVARDSAELREVAARGLRVSPVGQILLERYVGEFKQLEYQVVRDRSGNALTVCNMENVLSMRVHTGDNVVVAPSQTLDDHEYQMLRQAALRAVEECGIVGECNIQFCLDPTRDEYYAIEVNARLSRSSALASKATGYPLAYIAAKLALGYTLPELKNRVTGVTSACFEPALDYVVVKLPRWDLDKFPRAERRLGPSMKSVGEVMGIGASFPEALLKAVRMSDPRADLVPPETARAKEPILRDLAEPKPDILERVLEGLRAGLDPATIASTSWIDRWFVDELAEVEKADAELRRHRGVAAVPLSLLRAAKELGFSDRAIARATKDDEERVRQRRISEGLRPRIRMVDTLAGEWPSATNYLYVTYRADADDVGPVRGGQHARPRGGPVPDRLLRRVRLVDDEPRRGVEGGRDPGGRAAELQPRDRLHRLRPVRPALLRGDHARAGPGPVRVRVVRGRRHLRREPARPEPDAAPRCMRRPDPRHRPGVDRHRRGPREVRPAAREARDPAARLAGVHHRRGGGDVRRRGRLPGPRPPVVRPVRPGDAGHLRLPRPREVPRRSGAASPRSTRS